jgi:hypothetical protein
MASHHHHLSSGARGGVGFSGVLGLDFRILKMYLGVVGVYQGILLPSIYMKLSMTLVINNNKFLLTPDLVPLMGPCRLYTST